MVVAEELLINVRTNTAQAIAGLSAVEAKATGVSRSVSATMVAAGQKITKGFTLPLIAIGAIGMKTFADFDSAMTSSLAIMGDAADEWRGRMETAAREVGKTTTFSAKEAAESFYFLASAGLTAQQSIAALPQVAAFAQAGMFDLATATDLATDAQSALGLTVKDPIKNLENLTRVTDVLVRANTLANASVEQFSTALTTKAAAAARTLGMDIEEVTAVLAVMADAGVKGTLAGTQLAMALNNMTSNAVKNREAFEKYNITVFDSEGAMRNMADIVGDMSTAFGGMSDEAKVAAIMQLGFGDRAANTLKILLGTSEAMREYESAMRDASGFTEDVASRQLESFTARWGLLKDGIVDAGISLGEKLLPPLTDFVEDFLPAFATGVGKIKDFFESLPGWAQIAVVALGLVTAALSFMVAHPIIFGLVMIVGLIAAIGMGASKEEAFVRAFGDAFVVALDGATAASDAFVQVLSLPIYAQYRVMLDKAGISQELFAAAALGDAEAIDEFNRTLTEAAIYARLMENETDALYAMLRLLSPIAQDLQDDFNKLAMEESLAASDAHLLSFALDETGQRIRDVGKSALEAVPDIEDFADATEEEVYKVRNFFAELPEAVDMSMEEIKALFIENVAAQAAWQTNLEELTRMGLENLRAEFEAAGPSFAPALDDMMGEPFRDTLLEMGLAAGDEASTWGDMVTKAWQANPPDLLPVPVDFVTGSLPILPTFTATVNFKGGRPIYHGGIDTVPGPRGADVPATLQAGEGVLSIAENDARKRGGGPGTGSGPLINEVHIYGNTDPVSVAKELGWELYRRGT